MSGEPFVFVRIGSAQASNPNARLHDTVAAALEHALAGAGIEKSPDNARALVGGTAALLIGVCLEHGIDPRSIFSAGMVAIVTNVSKAGG
jgi:hypothetical protein